MKSDLNDIRAFLHQALKNHLPTLQIRKENDSVMEVAGTIPALQGKQQVDGYYFASVVPKPKDIRLYFFPIYTHPNDFEDLHPEVRKCLKGKSCFHIKKLDDAMEQAIVDMVQKGVDRYQREGFI
ncbi:MAG: hypothetical protein ACFB10_24860 [Salibacteraceae bacterium]